MKTFTNRKLLYNSTGQDSWQGCQRFYWRGWCWNERMFDKSREV